MLNLIVTAFPVIIWLGWFVLRVIKFLHIVQLEGYKEIRFLRWLGNNFVSIVSIREVISGVVLSGISLILWNLNNTETMFIIINATFWTIGGVYIIFRQPKVTVKKKLAFTARATRLFILSIILSIAIFSVLFWIILKNGWVLAPGAVFAVGLNVPLFLLLANSLIFPLEHTINNVYLLSARNKLKQNKAKVIAITGSYGKTSVKNILHSILSTRYNVLKTPESFNTPMGICKVIRGDLNSGHEIFIVEMGAKNRGDIRELCNLVQPDIGVITAIGPQHLEMFKTINNVADTKYELVESLNEKGVAVFNNDDEHCRILASKTNKKVLKYGIHGNQEKIYLTAKDISTSSNGVSFYVQNSSGRLISFHSRLLGRQNISNILAATTVAMECGMSLDEISKAAKRIEPTPHRLQLIQGAGGVTVIDDAFNANPVGANAAIEVLSEFKNGRKVLVTPGLVELGKIEYEENKKLGTKAAHVCDLVFLIGHKRTVPIQEGLKEAGFPPTKIYVVRSLNEATENFKNILKAGDVVLFENDLPDNYNE